jgi:hypothetical protein
VVRSLPALFAAVLFAEELLILTPLTAPAAPVLRPPFLRPAWTLTPPTSRPTRRRTPVSSSRLIEMRSRNSVREEGGDLGPLSLVRIELTVLGRLYNKESQRLCIGVPVVEDRLPIFRLTSVSFVVSLVDGAPRAMCNRSLAYKYSSHAGSPAM